MVSILSLFQRVVGKKAGDEKLDKELTKFFEASAKYRSSVRKPGVIIILDPSYSLFEAIRFIVEKCRFEMIVMHVETSDLARRVVEDYGEDNIQAVLASVDFIDNGFVDWINERKPTIPVFVTNCPAEREGEVPENYPVLVKGRAKIVDYVEALGFPDECRTYIEDVPNNAQAI